MFGPPPFWSSGLRLEFLTSAVDGTGGTIVVPATAAAGDFMVLLDAGAGSGGTVPADVVPTGFTKIATTSFAVGISTVRQTLSAKLVTAGQPGSTLTGIVGGASAKALAVYRAKKPLASFIVSAAVGNQGTTGNPTAQSIIATGSVAPVLALAGYGSIDATPGVDPRTFTPAKDGEIQSDDNDTFPQIDIWLAWKIMNRTGQLADITVDMDDEGASALQSCFITFTA